MINSSSSAGRGTPLAPTTSDTSNRREAGQRVELVDEDPAGRPLQKEVHARHSREAAEPEGFDGEPSHLARDRRRDRRRNEQARFVLSILVVVVVELVTRNDLPRNRRAGLLVSEDRALELPRVDALASARSSYRNASSRRRRGNRGSSPCSPTEEPPVTGLTKSGSGRSETARVREHPDRTAARRPTAASESPPRSAMP